MTRYQCIECGKSPRTTYWIQTTIGQRHFCRTCWRKCDKCKNQSEWEDYNFNIDADNSGNVFKKCHDCKNKEERMCYNCKKEVKNTTMRRDGIRRCDGCQYMHEVPSYKKNHILPLIIGGIVIIALIGVAIFLIKKSLKKKNL